MILVDGKKLAQDILTTVMSDVRKLEKVPRMVVITCEPNFETQKYLALKKQKAETSGISLTVKILPIEATTVSIIDTVKEAVESCDGIIVQLPLPAHIDTSVVLDSIPKSHDVDGFGYQSGNSFVLPPVVGAIDEIAKKYHLDWKGKNVVIFGSGRLVGGPALIYAHEKGAEVTVLTATSQNVEQYTKQADIIILGVGKPRLLLPTMIKAGAVVFDAGASEDDGLLVGDADPELANKSAIFTPVPGGIGPVTVALLFRNLLELTSRQ